jgi:hypothetical protein
MSVKRSWWLAAGALALLAAFPAGARAQVFYSMPGARPVPDESPALGIALGLADNRFRLDGFGRFNASQRADIGLEVVYEDLDTGPGSNDSSRFGAGADFKYLAVRQGSNTPVDAAVQFGAGVLARSGYTLIRMPLGALVSRTFTVDRDRDIVPYGGVYLIMDFVDHDTPGNNGFDSDIDVEMRVGASAEISTHTSVFAALHAGNGTMFFLGFSVGL